ncbi:transducin-like enhancer protein 6 isoform X3 [Elephas maximus indicus]|uniref:transducin-like enhancer protein 6 isoform X3 n=1 Tax=Elephas maximus indicus TaxID=99487 RepID=UPI002115ECA0|nr:transducin-like enhancer protein 6 isoform X3 [Elephas maximus indicus]
MSRSLLTSQRDTHRMVKTQTSTSKGLQQLSEQNTLDQLKKQSLRALLQLSTQLENICHSLQKIQKDLQEHHEQEEDYLKITETCSQTLDSQPLRHQVSQISPGEQSRKPASFKAPWQPELKTPQPSSLQEQNFKGIVASRSSAWSQQPPQRDSITTQPPSFFSSQPRLWQDVLTERLFHIYTGSVTVPMDPPRHGEQAPGLENEEVLRSRDCSAAEKSSGNALVPRLPTSSSSPPSGYSAAEMSSGDTLAPRLPLSCSSRDSSAAETTSQGALGNAPRKGLAQCGKGGACPKGLRPRCYLFLSLLVLNLPTSSSSSPGVSRERGTSLDMAADETQEPAGIMYEFLKPISWDLEDFEDNCKRPDTFPWKSKKLAVPYKLEKRRTLDHGELVLAVAVSSFMRLAFTCARGGVKVWSLTGQKARDRFPVSHIPVQTPRAYLRTCLLFPDSTALLTGGSNLACVSLWDLAASQLHVTAQLPCEGLSCQALAASPQDSLAFAGFTNGALRIWDLRDEHVVRHLPDKRGNGTRSVVVKGPNVWVGGLDTCLRCWDLRMAFRPREYQFESQIMSLAHSPNEDWVLLGMANGQQWLQHTSRSESLMVADDHDAILSLKFSPYGQWWVSVGLDNLITIYSTLTRKKLFQVPETCVMCCDVALNSRLIVTGSRDNASVYQVTY